MKTPFLLPELARPPRIQNLPRPPSELWTTGDLYAARAIAIIGTRQPHPRAVAYAETLAARVASAGAVVVSGGAAGIDRAAHEGALAAGGRTWAVLGHGYEHTYPRGHAELFDRIADSAGACVWPFPPEQRPWSPTFLQRNGVLVAMADAVVFVQSGAKSGARNATAWARKLGRPVFVVTPPPWETEGFEGNILELRAGGLPLSDTDTFLEDVHLISPSHPRRRQLSLMAALPSPREPELDPFHASTLEAVPTEPAHFDEIARRAGLPAHELAAALLTLALENVVVEGPSGFYRRIFPR